MSQRNGNIAAYSDPPLPLRMLSVVECVCLRPRLYTPGGTAGEVAAFLDGYFMGIGQGREPDDPAVWAGFKEWLPVRLTGPEGAPWFQVLTQSFPEEAIAVEQLRTLFLEFKERGIAEQGRCT